MSSYNNYTLFFYGTLMDSTVLKGVTGPDYQKMRRVIGVLKDFKRRKVKDAQYPAIIGSVGEKVEGIVVSEITSHALAQLDKFEDDDYSTNCGCSYQWCYN